MWMLCRKRKAERKAKRVLSVSAHFPEHNIRRRRKFRAYESISSLPAHQSVTKVKTTMVNLPFHWGEESQRKKQIPFTFLHRQIKQNKVKSKGIFFLPWVYSTKIFLLNNEKGDSSSNLRTSKVTASVFPPSSHFPNHRKEFWENFSRISGLLWSPMNKAVSEEEKSWVHYAVKSLPSLII